MVDRWETGMGQLSNDRALKDSLHILGRVPSGVYMSDANDSSQTVTDEDMTFSQIHIYLFKKELGFWQGSRLTLEDKSLWCIYQVLIRRSTNMQPDQREGDWSLTKSQGLDRTELGLQKQGVINQWDRLLKSIPLLQWRE